MTMLMLINSVNFVGTLYVYDDVGLNSFWITWFRGLIVTLKLVLLLYCISLGLVKYNTVVEFKILHDIIALKVEGNTVEYLIIVALNNAFFKCY